MKINKLSKNILFMLFVPIFLFGTGFSSWILAEGGAAGLSDSFDVQGNFGNVVMLNKYISLNQFKGDNNSGISSFKYNSNYGFIKDNVFGNVAEVTYFMSFSYKDFIENNTIDNLNIFFELSYKAYIDKYLLLDQYNNGSVNIKYSCSNGKTYFDSSLTDLPSTSELTPTHSIKTSTIFSLDEINNSKLNYINLELKYNFNISDENTKKQILDSELPFASFVLNVSISGY